VQARAILQRKLEAHGDVPQGVDVGLQAVRSAICSVRMRTSAREVTMPSSMLQLLHLMS
jgi:hypothetical protein